jgi:D-sedoheptulose 7-phosphate isomerase
MDKRKPIDQLAQRYKQLEFLIPQIEKAAAAIIDSYSKGGKVLVCGNGGSASDADHIVGELMKSFERKRPLKQEIQTELEKIAGERGVYLATNLQQGLPAISLNAHSALISAVANDIDATVVYAQQVAGYGNSGDVLIGLSTSGNSQNVIDALAVAKAKGVVTIGITGKSGGKIKDVCDILINVSETRTAFVQELHLPVYHTICMMVEDYFF